MHDFTCLSNNFENIVKLFKNLYFSYQFLFILFWSNKTKLRINYLVFNHCISDVLPSSYECNKQLFKEKGHKIFSRRQAPIEEDAAKCERVNPLSKKLIIEKVQYAEGFLGLYISNILSRITDQNDVQGVRPLF